ncbi:cortactin-binding protein 2 isoform X2 [Carassius carassius]|uniref:cortactin-binding protein 2 isoform X2 n=1 Tax=Carassius carassius TaxID=217509 RepID=UPI002868DA9E|nr:cortactin-binding protein 2 isoform X2 [Carassius carassius]
MASDGAKGEQPPPLQTLVTTGPGSVEAKCELNIDNLSKPELLTLLSIMEGELEARDLVIEALRARRKEVFLQERYGQFSLTDPFLALQRDFESGTGPKDHRPVSASPITVLEAVMAHCRKMQERMSAQLSAAESRQKRLEMEKLQLQSLEQEHRKLSAQLKDEREKNKHVVMSLVHECKQLAARVVEENQRFEELSSRTEQEGRSVGRLEEELAFERRRSQQMEAEMEKQLAEFDTEREQLRSRLSREEMRAAELRAESENLRQQVEQLRTERCKDAPPLPSAPASAPVKRKTLASVAVGTEATVCKTASSQTDVPLENEGAKKVPLSIPVKPTGSTYASMNLPKTSSVGRGLHHVSSQAENGGEGQTHLHGSHSPSVSATLPTGVSPRVQAARYKFQPSASEQDQNGTANQSPPSRDLSPTNRDNFAAKQQARHTVTQVLSRFTSPPAGGPPATLRPGLPHSTSEGGPFTGRLGHSQIGLKSPTVARIDRGNPPPIPPKKPGLSQTPSPPHPPIKVVGEASRSPGTGLGVGLAKSTATPQLPPKPSIDLGGTVPALTASQVGAYCTGWPWGCVPWGHVECPLVTTSSTATIVSSPSINPPTLPSHSLQHPGSPLAAASGWCPSIVSSLTCGDPVPLDDGQTLLLQAASQGNVTLLSMLLNQDPLLDIHLHQHELTSALISAAFNGHKDCLNLLLTSGASADAVDETGFTPLHAAAENGHHECMRALVKCGADLERECLQGRTPLYLACEQGHVECVKVLLDAGADCSHVTTDNCTALHAAVSSGHVGPLKLLLHHPSPEPDLGLPASPSNPNQEFQNPCITKASQILKHSNQDGWTAAHIAASRGYKKCLEVLCNHSQQDMEKRDKCNRTIHDVATDDCKDLLENLGDAVWLPGQKLPQSPWDLIRKRLSQRITIRLKGLSECTLDEMTYDSLIPLQLLQNYVRLVEQYHNVIFHGLEGSFQEYMANQISHYIKHRQEAQGIGCDVVRVEIDESLSKEHLLEIFINCGFLVSLHEGSTGRCVVVVLEGLQRAHSLSHLLGDLCEALENRGSVYSLSLNHGHDGLYFFREGSFLIGTLAKPRLQGAELRLQQHFRWVQLRWDTEPLNGMLGRHLRRKLLHKAQGQCWASDDPVHKSLSWVCSVWHQLNACLSRLGTSEALLGPYIFLSCPVNAEQTQAIPKWLVRLWNAVIVPRVEDAVISRVTAKRSPSQRRSPNSKGLSPGQRAVVKAALNILLNKAVLQGCPLDRTEIDRFLPEFQGGCFPLSTIGSAYRKGGRKGRDNGAWRRANTSPRKKGSPASGRSSSCSLREGSLANSITQPMTNVNHSRLCDGVAVGLSLCSDEETDLIRELQTMCSSKSEPDISRIALFKEEFIMLPDSIPANPRRSDGKVTQPQTNPVTTERAVDMTHPPPQKIDGSHASPQRVTRPRSHLPVPSSRGAQQVNTTSSISLQSHSSNPSRASTSSRARQPPSHNNSNNFSSQDNIWFLDPNCNENYSNHG